MSASAPALRPAPLPAHGWSQAAATAVARRLARWYYALEVRGLEHLPRHEACLLCANHTSHVDTFALACAAGPASRRLVFLGARDYFSRFRWRGRLLRRIICLVDFERAATAAALKRNLAQLGACRDQRRIIVLFPEGTRARDGRMAPFKAGAAMFADRLRVPVVPCLIEGAHAALPKGQWRPRRSRLRVSFGRPIACPLAAPAETGAQRAARYEEFAAELQRHVVQLGGVAERERTPVFSA